MYIDGVIAFSLLMIALILVMMTYIGLYFYRHIQRDTAMAEKTCQNCEQCECDKQASMQTQIKAGEGLRGEAIKQLA